MKILVIFFACCILISLSGFVFAQLPDQADNRIDFSYADTSTANINSSEYWVTNVGSLDNVNASQFLSDGQTLSILESYIQGLITGGTGEEDTWRLNYSFYIPTTTIFRDYLKINGSNANENISIPYSIKADWFNGKFNWTSANNWNSFDGSTLTFNESKFNSTYHSATQSEAVAGTIDGGTLTDTQHTDGNYDGVTFNFSEEAGSPGLDLRMNFTGLTSFNSGVMRYKTSNLAGTFPIIQMWNYVDEGWEDYPAVAESKSFKTITQDVFDSSEHVNILGVAQMRIYKSSNGNTNNHYYVDWVAVIKGYIPSGNEVDPIYKQEIVNYYNKTFVDNNFSLYLPIIATGDINLGGFNITNVGNITTNYYCNTTTCYSLERLIKDTGGEGTYNISYDTHMKDNTQAHSDYLINNGNDVTAYNLQAASLIATGIVYGDHADITNTIEAGTTIKAGMSLGVGVNAPTNGWDLFALQGTRANDYAGMYLKNLAADGISRWNLGMTMEETTLGILTQYDAEDGRAIILNRKATTGTLDLATTGGGIDIDNDGGVRMGAAVDDAMSNLRATYWDSTTGDIGYDSSSARYKENILDMEIGLGNKILELKPVTYDKINGEDSLFGFIAEDVNELYPQCVFYKREEVLGEICISPDDCYEGVVEYRLEINKTTGEKIPEGINYECLISPLVKQIQTYEDRINSLEDDNILLRDCITNSKDFVEMQECIK